MANTENIGLSLTPRVNGLAAVDRLIERLERLSQFENTTIHLKVVGNLQGLRESVAAMGHLSAQTAGLQTHARAAAREMAAVAEAFRRTGRPSIASAMEKSLLSTGEAARVAAGDVKRLSAEMERLKADAMRQARVFEIKYRDPSKLGYGQLSQMAGDRAQLDSMTQLLKTNAELLKQAAATQAAVQQATAPAHESAVQHGIGAATETKIISDAELLTEFRKHGFGNLEGAPAHAPIELKSIEQLKSVLDKRLSELNAAVRDGTQLMAREGAPLTRSTVRYRQDPKTGEMVAVRQTSQAVTGPGERTTVSRTAAPGGSGIDVTVNEEVRRMAEAMSRLSPELQRAAKTLADSMTISEARSRGVTNAQRQSLIASGAMAPSGYQTNQFREAARFSLAGVTPLPPVADTAAGAAQGAQRLARAEADLARESAGSAAALGRQDAVLLEKLRHLKEGAAAAGGFAKEEAAVAAESAQSAAALGAAAEEEKRLIQQRYRDGRLVQKTFADEGGVTRKVNFGKGGKEVTTEEFNRLKKASQEVKAVRDEFTQLIATRKAEGAAAAQIAAEYTRYGQALQRVAREYADLEKAGITTIGRMAEAQKLQGGRVLSIDARKQAAAAAKEAERQRKEAQRQEQQRLALLEKQHREYYARAQKEAEAFNRRYHGERLLAGFEPQGYREESRSTRTTAKGRTVETINYARENAQMRESVRVTAERDRAGRLLNATVSETSKVMKESGRAAGYSAKDFLRNTFTVTAWATSVAALYGALNLLKRGGEGMEEVEAKTATLVQVFRGGEPEALRLRDAVLALGVAYNRSAGEALDAAIRFSRLGLTRAEATEAVAVSLQAANVAEISAAEAAEQLSAIYAAYNLQVGQLRGTLAQLNSISNTYNATNKQMLAGIARVAPVAKQAGLSLNELTALVGAGIGRTGRPGSEFGNAIKAMIAQVNDPKTQAKLQGIFNVDVTGAAGQIKDFSTVLRELFVRYQELNGADRQQLALLLGKKMQVSRLTALLDGYVQAQVLAIRSGRDLNSAESENARIRETLRSQLQGLATAYDSLFTSLGHSNVSTGVNSFLANFVELLKNLLNLLARGGDATATLGTGLAALGALMLVNIARTGEMGEASGFLTNSLVSCRQAAQTLWKEFLAITTASARMVPGLNAATAALRLTGGALLFVESVTGLVVVIAAVTAAGWALNKAMGGINRVFAEFADESEKANARLAGFNEQLERLRNAAKAEGDLAALSQTLSKAVLSPNAAPEDAAEWLRVYEQVAGVQRGELLNLYRIGDMTRLLSRLEEIRAGARRKQLDLQMQGVKVTRAELAALREREAASAAALGKKKIDPETDDAHRALQNRRRELEGRASDSLRRALEEEGDGTEQVSEAQERQNKLLEEKLKLIDRLYGAMSHYTEVEKLDDDLAAQRAKLALLDREKAARIGRRTSELQEQLDANGRDPRAADYRAALRKREDNRAAMELYQQRLTGFRKGLDRQVNLLEDPLGLSRYGALGNLGTAAYNLVWGSTRNLDPGFGARLGAMRPPPMPGLPAVDPKLAKEAAGWSERNVALKKELDALNSQATTGEQEALQKQREAIEATIAQIEQERRLLAVRLDAIAAGRRAAEAIRGEGRTGQTGTEQDLNEMRAALDPTARVNRFTGLSNTAAALEEYRRLRGRLDSRRESGEPTDERDEIRALQLQEQLRATGVRLEELRQQAVQRVHAIEAEITNEKIKQQREASRSLLQAGREDQLRAAQAARMARRRGRGFTAEEFQYIDQPTKQAITQTNPDVLPAELQGRLTELREEKRQLEEFFQGLEGFNAEVKTKAEELRNLRLEAPVLGGEGGRDDSGAEAIEQSGELIARAVQTMSGRVVTALDAAGGQIVDAITRMGAGLDARVSRLERGSLAAAVGRAQGAAVSAMG